MDFYQILLEILINGTAFFLLFNSFLNLDLMTLPQIAIFASIIMNGYLINKKVLRDKKCKISYTQLGVAFGIGVVNFIFLGLLKKIFS